MTGTMPRQTNAGRKHSPSGPAISTPARSAVAAAACVASCRHCVASPDTASASATPEAEDRRASRNKASIWGRRGGGHRATTRRPGRRPTPADRLRGAVSAPVAGAPIGPSLLRRSTPPYPPPGRLPAHPDSTQRPADPARSAAVLAPAADRWRRGAGPNGRRPGTAQQSGRQKRCCYGNHLRRSSLIASLCIVAGAGNHRASPGR